MTSRIRYSAEYQYPGMLFPESTYRDLGRPTLQTVIAAAPDEDGYFRKDGWYAVVVTEIHEKLFVAADGEQTWVKTNSNRIAHWVVGAKVHADDIAPTDRNSILIANIRGNSRDGGYGVRCRSGNWQIASDYDAVLSPAEVSA